MLRLRKCGLLRSAARALKNTQVYVHQVHPSCCEEMLRYHPVFEKATNIELVERTNKHGWVISKSGVVEFGSACCLEKKHN